jgi:two-component system chemotaxis sensor kinase CheA
MLDNSAYLGVFLDELEEQLQILDEECLILEQKGSNMETIQRIFRAAHTLKGSSAAMGFEGLKELTHRVENVFDWLRSGKLSIHTELINVLFDALDSLKSMKQDIICGNMDTPAENVMARLDQFVLPQPEVVDLAPDEEDEWGFSAQESFIKLDAYQKEAVKQAANEGWKVYAVYVKINRNALMKQVRALLIYNNLKEFGEIISSYPPADLLEREDTFQGSMVLVVVTMEDQQVIQQSLNQISDIESISVQPIGNSDIERDSEGSRLQIIQPAVAVKEEIIPLIPKQQIEPDSKIKINQTVRVDVDRLERLLNFVGELIIDNTRLHEVKNRLSQQFQDHQDVNVLSEIASHFSRVIGELQEGMMKTRMLPIEQLFSRFPCVIRDISQKSGKEIELILDGKETELDRTLIEELGDPILHILRNAADHGLESTEERIQQGKPAKGQILLKAHHQENQIVLTIADDGRGIDPLKIKKIAIQKGFLTEAQADQLSDKELIFLIFHSGFSTASSVTDLSGRGVGMDIVRAQIEKLNGIIDIETSIGGGTVFTIKLPLTLAIIRSLLIKLGKQTFAVPLVNVIEIVRIGKDEIRTVQGQEICVIRGTIFPLVRMHHKLQITEEAKENSRLFVVMIGIAERRVCIVVDQLVGNQEVVIKSLGSFVGNVPYIAGSTILGDGNVALILDAAAMVREEGSSRLNQQTVQAVHTLDPEEKQYVTFGLGTVKYAFDINQVKEIMTIPSITQVVYAPSHQLGIINLRGVTLPVFDLRTMFKLPAQDMTVKSRIIVLEIRGKEMGILVDEVTEVLNIVGSYVQPVPNEWVEEQKGLISGAYETPSGFIMLLQVESLLGVHRKSELYASTS